MMPCDSMLPCPCDHDAIRQRDQYLLEENRPRRDVWRKEEDVGRACPAGRGGRQWRGCRHSCCLGCLLLQVPPLALVRALNVGLPFSALAGYGGQRLGIGSGLGQPELLDLRLPCLQLRLQTTGWQKGNSSGGM